MTICTQFRSCALGTVTDGIVHVSSLGNIVLDRWIDLLNHHRVELDAFVVMSNHLHGIIVILPGDEGAAGCAPTPAHGLTAPGTLSVIVRSFKAAATKSARVQGVLPEGGLWQRGYYEHVIRSEKSLESIREYIDNNPAQWALDRDNPNRWR